MSHRFFVESPITGERARLAGQEAQHLAKVMRLREGDEVVLFDGEGEQFTAAIEKIGRAAVDLRILSREAVHRELNFQLTVGVALPKGDRQRWLVEKLTELGVTDLVPLVTTRGVAQPEHGTLAKLRRYVIEASKQSGRNRLLQIAEPASWTTFLTTFDDAWIRLVAHPAAADASARPYFPAAGKSVAVAIGPEGGLTDEEFAMAQSEGWSGVDLGPRILRVETAALALVAAISVGSTA